MSKETIIEKDVTIYEDNIFTYSNTNRLTNWKNEPKFKDLYENYKDARSNHQKLIDELDERFENMQGGKSVKAPKGKSKIKSKLIRQQAEWKYPALEEPFLSTDKLFKLRPRTWKDIETYKQAEQILAYQWENEINKVQFINQLVRRLVDEGTVIVKVGWKIEEEIEIIEKKEPIYAKPEEALDIIKAKVEAGLMTEDEANFIIQNGKPLVIGEKTVKKPTVKIVENRPEYIVCDPRDIIIDPTVKNDISEAQFIIHSYDVSFSDLKKEEYYEEIIYDEKTGKEIVKKSGIYKNLDKIKFDNYDYQDTYYHEYINEDTDYNFEFKDKARKKVRAYDYYGYWDINGNGVEPIIATWVGDVLIRLEKSPYPFKGLPFEMCKYMPRPNRLYGESDGDLLKEHQETIGKFKRAMLDITAEQAVGQEFIDEQFFASPSQKENYKAGRTVFFRHGMDPRISIHRKSIDPVPKVAFDMIAMENANAEALTGTKAFSQGISSQAFGSSATAIRSAMNATVKRELSILRRIGELLKNIAKKTISMNQMFLEDEKIIRITDGKVIKIDRENIVGNFDIIVEISTPEIENEKTQDLVFLLQTIGVNMDTGIRNKILAKIASLKKMPDLAHDILNHKEEVNPAQEQIQKIQLENAMLENKKLKMEIAKIAKDIQSEDSKITERESRASKNLRSETIENISNAELKKAQAIKAEKEAELINLKINEALNEQNRNY